RHPAANRNRTARYRVRVPARPLFLSRLDSSAARITRCAAPADRSRRQCASLFRRNRTTHARIAREQYSDGHDEIFWRIAVKILWATFAALLLAACGGDRHAHDREHVHESAAHAEEKAHNGRTTIPVAVAAAAGVKTATAGPGVVSETLTLYGRIQPDAERVRSVGARFPGPIRSVARQIGDSVNAGDTLAVIESNESLQTYAVKTPISGVITERHANPGEVATAESLFVVTDF